ncbi:RidA family protein [Herbiconiux sp. A18JL235]|uniref:RidA family protein n=1 Tax=Herbiconiux sp. A18JL235 TaxID=3152363 RepID=A0AB39BHQ4_9MICO
MSKTSLSTDAAPAPAGAYSQAVVANGFVFTAGLGPHDPATGAVPAGIAAQTRATLENISAILRECGCVLDDAVKVTVHLADLADFVEYDKVFGTFFSHPRPVRTTVGSQLAGILVEIDVVAALPVAATTEAAAVEETSTVL